MEAVLAGLEAVRREAIRRESGVDPPDRRFDLALDILADLAEELAKA